MRRLACLLLLALPATAAAHNEVPARFEAPLGAGNVVERGEPVTVRWRDTDLGDGTIALYATTTPPPPRVSSWPLDQVEGTLVHGPVPMADGGNEATIDTATLAPGHWFFWLGLEAVDGHTQYVPPGGVLTVVEPGQTPPPSVWFDAPARNDTAQGGSHTAVITTAPAEGVEVLLRARLADGAGVDRDVAWQASPGSAQAVALDLRCVAPEGGWVAIHASVRAPDDQTGEVWATGRILVPAGAGAAEECPALPADGDPAPGGGSGSGGGCAAAEGGVTLLSALALAALRRR